MILKLFLGAREHDGADDRIQHVIDGVVGIEQAVPYERDRDDAGDRRDIVDHAERIGNNTAQD